MPVFPLPKGFFAGPKGLFGPRETPNLRGAVWTSLLALGTITAFFGREASAPGFAAYTVIRHWMLF